MHNLEFRISIWTWIVLSTLTRQVRIYNLIISNIAPATVGPGAYGGSKFKHIKEKSPKREMLPNGAQATSNQLSVFGNETRFKGPNGESPGPGSYADMNKWHKKTYNLKFLNVA